MQQDFTLIDNEAERQFQFDLEDGERAFITYRWLGEVIVLMHTEVPENAAGKGIASQLALKAFTALRAKGIKAKIYCAFLLSYLKRHPEWNDSVAEQ